MINKVYAMLSELGLPLDHIQRPSFGESSIVVSYHFFNQGIIKYGDGESKVEGGALQIDLFVKHDHATDPQPTITQIKKLLKENGFRPPSISSDGYMVDGIGQVDQFIFISNYKE